MLARAAPPAAAASLARGLAAQAAPPLEIPLAEAAQRRDADAVRVDALRGLQVDAHLGLRTVRLDRPKALNSLNLDMIRQLTPLLAAWEANEGVSAVLLEGAGGKAFCAGGDVVSLHHDPSGAPAFFGEEYQLDYALGTCPKPVVALLNGITMGGGVGLSVHAPFTVATEKTLFAMPETGIGLFPDVGGSHFLPRLRLREGDDDLSRPGKLGMYLALTGARLQGRELVDAGVASQFLYTDQLENFKEALAHALAQFDDSGAADVAAVLADMAAADAGYEGPAFERHADMIQRCFGGDSVEEIVALLREHGGDEADKTAHKLENVFSPTSVKITHRQLHTGHGMSLADCLRMEYRIATRCALEAPDFSEGVRALLVDRDNAPVWNPKTLGEVTTDAVDAFFAPLDKELQLEER